MPVKGNILECPNPICKKVQPQINLTECIFCGSDLGAPNVNIVSAEFELVALKKRYKDAIEYSNVKKTNEFINKFESFFENNVEVIINLHLPVLAALIKDKTYKNYHRAVQDGERLIASLHDDQKRNVIDSILYGSYGRDMVYAALTLNNKGLISYGRCSIIIDEDAIKFRTSILEENSYDFVKTHKLNLENLNIPLGYRSKWDNKTQLVVSKLHKSITTEDEKDFCNLVLSSDGGKHTDKFIEVHIYKEVSILTFKQIYVPYPKNKMDEFMVKTLEEKCPGKVVRV
jgi:hypothetical protein